VKLDLIKKLALTGAVLMAVPAMSATPATVAPTPAVVAPAVAPAPAAATVVTTPVAAPAPAAVTPVAAPAPVPAPAVVAAPAPEVAPAPAEVAPAIVAAPVVAPVAAPVAEVKPVAPAPKVIVKAAPVKKAVAKDEIEVTMPAKIDIQGKKVMWNKTEDVNGNNLEDWFGRAYLSLATKSKKFDSKLTIRAFPADFGNKSITKGRDSLAIDRHADGTIASASLIQGKTDTVKTDKFQLYEAWTYFKGGDVDLKLGRYFSNDRVGSAFGNYADNDDAGEGALFMPAGQSVNAIEVSRNFFENVDFRMAFESNDKNLNKADLRVGLKLSNLASLPGFKVGVNYRNDMFNLIKEPDSIVHNNAAFSVEVPLGKWRFWSEVGMRKFTSDGASPVVPVTGGIDIPLGRVLDKLLVEAEFNNDRVAVKGKTKKVLGSMFMQKKVSNRFLISFGVQSNNQTADYAMIGRLSATIN